MSLAGTPSTRWRGTVLGIWTIGLAVLLILGRYRLFLRPGLWPLQLATATIMFLFLLAMIRRHGGGARKITLAAWVRGGMLLLPLLYMTSLLSGASLNSVAAGMRYMDSSVGADAGAATADTSQILNLEYIATHVHGLAGKQIMTEGRVMKDDSMGADEMKIYRFVIVCCAADALPVELDVKSAQATQFHTDEWVLVTGKVSIETRDGNPVAVFHADKIDQIPPPAEPYLSPNF
ncbi:MAG TPA: TIGR03943 family protein [Tepidisphaeraceae bacterium]|nr:TIGR03943 family protein [Tepidisphaeraceae bacterium]